MTNESLQYYLHDEPDAFRLELSGSLSGDGARSVYNAWRTALSIIGSRPTVIDITYISEIDARGRTLLRLWRSHAARIIAASPQSRALAESVLDERYPAPPARISFVRRAAAFLFRLAKNAGLPAAAEGRHPIPAAARLKSADSHNPEDRSQSVSPVPYSPAQEISNGARKCFE